jgi:hypothetical protein
LPSIFDPSEEGGRERGWEGEVGGEGGEAEPTDDIDSIRAAANFFIHKVIILTIYSCV